jgi:hypothetical protein
MSGRSSALHVAESLQTTLILATRVQPSAMAASGIPAIATREPIASSSLLPVRDRLGGNYRQKQFSLRSIWEQTETPSFGGFHDAYDS